MGTVVQVSAGDAEAGVVFDGENVEACEKIRVQDLEATGVGFQADPDTPAQPVVAQLLSLLGALLQSDEVFRSLKTAGPERLGSDIRGMVWSRMLSQTLRAVLQLSVHCSDAVVAACEEGDVVTRVLPTLLQVAVCPIQLPTLMTAQASPLCCRANSLASVAMSRYRVTFNLPCAVSSPFRRLSTNSGVMVCRQQRLVSSCLA